MTGYLNLMANSIDNFTHGLAVAASFLVGIKVWYSFFIHIILQFFVLKYIKKISLDFLKIFLEYIQNSLKHKASIAKTVKLENEWSKFSKIWRHYLKHNLSIPFSNIVKRWLSELELIKHAIIWTTFLNPPHFSQNYFQANF